MTAFRTVLGCILFQWVASHLAHCTIGDDKVTPKVEWQAETTEPENSFSSLLVIGDQVVVGDDEGVLHSFHRVTGEQRWTTDHASRIYTNLTTDGERVFFPSGLGLCSVSPQDGEEQWLYGIKGGGNYCAYSKHHKLLVVGGNDAQIHAVAARDGAKKWTLNIVDDAPADPPGWDGAGARIGGSIPARPTGIACDETFAFVCIFDQCRVVAIDLTSGKKKWSTQTGGWTSGTPTLSDDSVYVASQDGYLWKLDKATGEVKWKFKTDGRVDDCALDGGFAFFGSSDGRCYCVNVNDGKEKWRFEVERRPDQGGRYFSMPHVGEKTAIFAAGRYGLYSLEKATGKVKWHSNLFENAQVNGKPESDGERLFLRTSRRIDKSGQDAVVAVTPAE